MNSRFEYIRHSMLMYGILLGGIGGFLSGICFAIYAYSPIVDYQLLTIAIGGIAAGLVGLAFGTIAGLLCGWSMEVITRLMLLDYRLRRLYKPLMGMVASSICGLLFLKMAYMIGRPYIYYPETNITWIWTWFTVTFCAFLCGITTADSFLQVSHQRKPKNIN